MASAIDDLLGAVCRESASVKTTYPDLVVIGIVHPVVKLNPLLFPFGHPDLYIMLSRLKKCSIPFPLELNFPADRGPVGGKLLSACHFGPFLTGTFPYFRQER
jgi:hypothetical protein